MKYIIILLLLIGGHTNAQWTEYQDKDEWGDPTGKTYKGAAFQNGDFGLIMRDNGNWIAFGIQGIGFNLCSDHVFFKVKKEDGRELSAVFFKIGYGSYGGDYKYCGDGAYAYEPNERKLKKLQNKGDIPKISILRNIQYGDKILIKTDDETKMFDVLEHEYTWKQD